MAERNVFYGVLPRKNSLQALCTYIWLTLALMELFCFLFSNSSNDSKPAVIVLDQLNCLASLADIFDLSQLEKNSNW